MPIIRPQIFHCECYKVNYVFRGCENDESIFDLLNLNDALDIDVLLKDITNQTGVTISDEHINNSVLNGITTVIDMPNDREFIDY